MYDDGVGVRGVARGRMRRGWDEKRDGLLHDGIREKRKEGDGTIQGGRDGRRKEWGRDDSEV